MRAHDSPIQMGAYFSVGILLGSAVTPLLAGVGSFPKIAAGSLITGPLPYVLGAFLSPFRSRGDLRISTALSLVCGAIYPVAIVTLSRFGTLALLLWVLSPLASGFVVSLLAFALPSDSEEELPSDGGEE